MREFPDYHEFFEAQQADSSFCEARRLERMERVYEKACGVSEASPSHDFRHIQLTLNYAEILLREAKSLGLEPDGEKVFLAVCCHDLGRKNPSLHGFQSIEESMRLASVVLKNRGYTQEEAKTVCQIIREHGQPENKPTTVEAKILKEADFLAGLGTWGILRIILWAGESGWDIEEIAKSLEVKMPERIASLEFAASKAIAWKEWPIAEFFLASLIEQYQPKEAEVFPGKYLVLEGIGGTGKDTIAQMLAEYLRNQNLPVEIVSEPSELGRQTLDLWKNRGGAVGGITEEQKALLLAADRVAISKKIKLALREGKTVLGVRSFISTMVYQGGTELTVMEIMLNNRFIPRPEAVILLDILPSKALERIKDRALTRGTASGDYEEIEVLYEISRRYGKVISQLKPVTTVLEINSEKPKEKVFEEILSELKRLKIFD